MASKFTKIVNDSLRFSDVIDEPRRLLAPLRGYEHLELVSLDQATDPLISHVKEIKHMVHNALENSAHVNSPLPLDQRASIMLYSMEWSPRDRSFSRLLNNILRSPSRDRDLPPWLLYLKLFLTALAGLPSLPNRTVYRGVKMDLCDEYPIESRPIVWWGFTSCTASISVLEENEQFFGKSGTRTLFSIECDSGKDIRQLACHPEEEEILLLPGLELRVVGCSRIANDVTMIQLKEIDPAFPRLAPVPPSLLGATKPGIKLSYRFKSRGDLGELRRALEEALLEKECTELDLSSNEIKAEGAALLASALRNHQVAKPFFD